MWERVAIDEKEYLDSDSTRNIALLMILHAVWDIVIRIPNTFFGFPEECLGLTVLDVGGYAVSYTAMLAVAFFIAINYDNYVLKG